MNEAQQKKEKTGEDLLYSSMKQAYNDDESKDIVIQEIADEMSRVVYRVSYADQENQNLEGELARLELHKQDLDDELKVLINVGKEIPQVLFPRRTHL